MAGNMPAAAIQHGTLQSQRHVLATLETLAASVVQQRLASPAIIVIGEVAQLAQADMTALLATAA
jgi:uroporphyrin-III C-methyltransferase